MARRVWLSVFGTLVPVNLRQWLAIHGRRTLALGFLILFSGILLAALIPGRGRFEAQVKATQLSFVTQLAADIPRQTFLSDIRNLQEITLTGNYATPLMLTGQMNSDRFGAAQEATLELIADNSQIEIRLPASVPSEMQLLRLQLRSGTQVGRLRYVPAPRRLELVFTHPKIAQPDPASRSVLNVYLGERPLEFTVSGYRLTLPNQVLEETDNTRPLTFTYQPDLAAEWELMLPETGVLSLSLPELKNLDTLGWFWGLPVAQLEFIREEREGIDTRQRSTILGGQVRLGDQTLGMDSEQFLLLENPRSQQIRSLKLLADAGLEVRTTGEAERIEVGLDPQFPLYSASAKLIDQAFRPDIRVAIVSFSGAMVASLLLWLLDNWFQTPNTP